MTKIIKKLSANDIGSTGGHQAGILVPKDKEILSFFPSLDPNFKNPRTSLLVREKSDGSQWTFNFIYYNNRFFGGTRNEFRLTCMTKYLRAVNSKVGDDLIFTKNDNGSIFIECIRDSQNQPQIDIHGTLVLDGGWKIINIY